MKNNNLHLKPSLIQTISAVLTAGVMWGSGNVIIRSLLLEGLNEIFLVTARVLIIGTLLFSYYIIFNKDKFDKQLLKEASFTGLASIFFVSWAFIFALQYISSGLVTLLISSAPIFTAMWVKLILKEEKISKLKYLSVVVGFSGIAYLFISQETGLLNQGNIFLGGSLAFLGVQCIALATVLNRKYAPRYKVNSWLTFQYPLVIILTLLTFFISGVGIDVLNLVKSMQERQQEEQQAMQQQMQMEQVKQEANMAKAPMNDPSKNPALAAQLAEEGGEEAPPPQQQPPQPPQ